MQNVNGFYNNNVNRNFNRNIIYNPNYLNNYNLPYINNRNIYNINNNEPKISKNNINIPNNYQRNYNNFPSRHNSNNYITNNLNISNRNNLNYNLNNAIRNQAMNSFNNNNFKSPTPHIPHKNKKKNIYLKNNSNIQSNDFWQNIDNKKKSTIKNKNNSGSMNEVLDDFFGDFFNDEVPRHEPNSNHIQIRMGEPSEDEDIEPHVFFHPFFSPFGIMSGVFQQNYSSNFGRQIARLIEMAQRGKNPHPPASKKALKRLKRFSLKERFCKRKNGKIELPNCCICQCEIEIREETVLLPCGHMYHWDCCLQWLKTNNTCPICRFEIK